MREYENIMHPGGSFIPATFDPIFHDATDVEKSWVYKMPYRKLGNTDLHLSLLSYGGSALANYYSDNASRSESIQAIQLALKSGVNYIETGPWYGPSEKIIGEAIKDIPRNAFYLSTKAGRYSTPGWENRFDYTFNRVLESIESSLSLLGVQCVDIVQIHDIEFCLDQEVLIKETLPALESVVRAGKAKHIGITSYCLETMKNLVEKSPIKIDSILSYSRYNFHDVSLESYVPFFKSNNVGVINASPVAMGLFTSRGPPPWHPASPKVKELSEQVRQLTETRGITIEQAALGFGLRPETKEIASTLVSMPTKEIVYENLDVVTRPYSDKDKQLYDDILNFFKAGLGNTPGHWEGVELAEYKQTL